MIPDQVRKWLKQQSKDFYAAGFDTVVKRRDKCINVGGGYVEYHMSFILYPFLPYLLIIPRIKHYLLGYNAV
jgi:hypothetical protein